MKKPTLRPAGARGPKETPQREREDEIAIKEKLTLAAYKRACQWIVEEQNLLEHVLVEIPERVHCRFVAFLSFIIFSSLLRDVRGCVSGLLTFLFDFQGR